MCCDDRIATFPEAVVGVILQQGLVIPPGVSFTMLPPAVAGQVPGGHKGQVARKNGQQQPAEPAVEKQAHEAAAKISRVNLVPMA